MDGAMRTCTKCGEMQPVSSFRGGRNQCKKCKMEYQKSWYAANADKVRERNKTWQAANPDKVRETNAMKSYDLSREEYAIIWAQKQRLECDLCGTEHDTKNPARMHIDHIICDMRPIVRSVLCQKCNTRDMAAIDFVRRNPGKNKLGLELTTRAEQRSAQKMPATLIWTNPIRTRR